MDPTAKHLRCKELCFLSLYAQTMVPFRSTFRRTHSKATGFQYHYCIHLPNSLAYRTIGLHNILHIFHLEGHTLTQRWHLFIYDNEGKKRMKWLYRNIQQSWKIATRSFHLLIQFVLTPSTKTLHSALRYIASILDSPLIFSSMKIDVKSSPVP